MDENQVTRQFIGGELDKRSLAVPEHLKIFQSVYYPEMPTNIPQGGAMFVEKYVLMNIATIADKHGKIEHLNVFVHDKLDYRDVITKVFGEYFEDGVEFSLDK